MLYANPAFMAFILSMVGVLGLVMGSFINCWAWRSTHGESVLAGRSHCATCNHVLGAADLVPVFSWLFSKGQCRYCGQRVSARYPATEILCGAVYVAIVAVYGPTLQSVELIAFASILLFLSLTDLDCHLIPNGCIIAAIVVRAAYIVVAGMLEGADMQQMAISSLVGGVALGLGILVIVLVADRVLGRESMGWGDVKLFAVAGLYFGWQQGLLLVIVACIVGLVSAVVALSDPKTPDSKDDDSADSDEKPRGLIPFGPSIAVACIITMLVGQPFINWYLSLLA